MPFIKALIFPWSVIATALLPKSLAYFINSFGVTVLSLNPLILDSSV